MLLESTLYDSHALATLLKILMAAVAGSIVGLERERHGRPAGLRTHLLVSVGACLMMILSEAFYLKYGHLDAASAVRLDPARVAAQIITGIGFLGAGVIIKEGLTVRGLTTAACLWVVAGLGMAFGMGLVGLGVIGTAVALFGLLVLKKLEPVIGKDRYLHLAVLAGSEEEIFADLEKIFTSRKLKITDLQSELDLAERVVRYEFVVTGQHSRIGRTLTNEIARLPGIRKIRYK